MTNEIQKLADAVAALTLLDKGHNIPADSLPDVSVQHGARLFITTGNTDADRKAALEAVGKEFGKTGWKREIHPDRKVYNWFKERGNVTIIVLNAELVSADVPTASFKL